MLGVCHSASGGWVLALRSESGRPVCVEAPSTETGLFLERLFLRAHPSTRGHGSPGLLSDTLGPESCQPLVFLHGQQFQRLTQRPCPRLEEADAPGKGPLPSGGGSFNVPGVILMHIPGKGRIAV